MPSKSELIRSGAVCGTCADEGETSCSCYADLEAATLCDTHEAGACPAGCPDSYTYEEEEARREAASFAARCQAEDEADRLSLLQAARRAFGLEADRELDEVTIELDACGDLDTLLTTSSMQVWIRCTHPHGPGGGWPVIEIRGKRRDVREYIGEHWGPECVDDLEEAGEL